MLAQFNDSMESEVDSEQLHAAHRSVRADITHGDDTASRARTVKSTRQQSNIPADNVATAKHARCS